MRRKVNGGTVISTTTTRTSEAIYSVKFTGRIKAQLCSNAVRRMQISAVIIVNFTHIRSLLSCFKTTNVMCIQCEKYACIMLLSIFFS